MSNSVAGDVGYVRNVVRDIQDAVSEAWRDWITNFEAQKITLTLRTVVTNKAGLSEFKVPLIEKFTPLTLSGGLDIATVSTQETELEIVKYKPKSSQVAPANIRSSIQEAVNSIKQVLEELKLSQNYGLSKAKITLEFLVTANGEIKVLNFSFSHKNEVAHKLVIEVTQS